VIVIRNVIIAVQRYS